MQVLIWVGCVIAAIWLYLVSFRFNLWAWEAFIETVVMVFYRSWTSFEVRKKMGKLRWLESASAVLCFIPGSGILALALMILEFLIEDLAIPVLVFVLNCLFWAPTGAWPVIEYNH